MAEACPAAAVIDRRRAAIVLKNPCAAIPGTMLEPGERRDLGDALANRRLDPWCSADLPQPRLGLRKCRRLGRGNERRSGGNAARGQDQSRKTSHKPPFSTSRLTAINGNAISAKLFRLNREAGRAEGAIDADHAIVADHVPALVGRKARNDRADVLRVAAAPAAELHGGERPELVLVVEQPPQAVVQR